MATLFIAPVRAEDQATTRSLFRGDSAAGLTKSFHSPEILQRRVVRVDLGVLGQSGTDPSSPAAGTEVSLDLFPDADFVAVVDSHTSLRWGGSGWTGHIADCPMSELFLVQRGQVLVGSVSCDGRLFQLRSQGEDRVEIRELDPTAFNEDLPDFEIPPFLPPAPFEKSGLEKSDSATRIDVMVAYSADARQAAGGIDGMRALIDLAFLETNTGYANSGVLQRLRLVHAVEVDYTETGSSSTDLSRLYSLSDGFLDEVHTLRDTYGADMISFWTATLDSCGRGYVMTNVSSGFAPAALNVVQIGCATGYYSFGHELGHNMGARHDWYVDQTNGSPHTHNKGYVNPTGGWRTIMAYGNECSDLGGSCTRVQHFSSPDATYSGATTGVAAGTDTTCTEGNLANPECDADNRLTLNTTASTVANFRQTQFFASLDLSAAPSTVDVGEQITFTLEARNETDVTATQIVMQTEVPTGTTLDPTSLSLDALSDGQEAGSEIIWTTFTDLPPGGTLTRTFTVTADSSGIVTGQATVSSWNGSLAVPSNSTEVTVLYHADCGFSEGFESGSLSAFWQTQTTENGRVSVLSAVPDTGSYSAVLDASVSGVFSEAALIFTADLAGAGQSQLSFRWRDFGDEYHSDYDGVFIRADKNSAWHKVFDFEGTYHDAYQDGTVDLDAAALAAGIVVADGFQIKFGQADNWYINTTTPASGDGYGIDGLSLVCTPQEVAAAESTQILAVGKDSLSWGDDPNATTYKLYRGVAGGLPGLASASVDSCLRWQGSATSVTGLDEVPGAGEGQLYWFLITGENAVGESDAGDQTAGPRQLDSGGDC